MKNKLLIAIVGLTLLSINSIAFGKVLFNNDEAIVPYAATCYQTMGYCSSWDLNYKCVLTPTSERCRIWLCNECLKEDSVN